MNKSILLAFFFFLFQGCKTVPMQVAQFDIKKPDVYFIADNQFHVIGGGPYLQQNQVSDRVFGVTIRPPQTTILGAYGFDALTEKFSKDSLVVHLGDGTDVSCKSELKRFLGSMSKLSNPWVFLPGNHDAYFIGNSQQKSDYKGWDDACGKSGRSNKKDLILSYLKTRFHQTIIPNSSYQNFHGKITEKKMTVAYYGRVYFSEDNAQKSFIVQKVNFTKKGKKFAFILIDTTQYHYRPRFRAFITLAKVAGVTGNMQANQIALVKKLVRRSQVRGESLYVVGHHPLKSSRWSNGGLSWKKTKQLKKIIKDHELEGYISAHTHKGGSRILDTIQEWNAPSLSDWPLGFLGMNQKNSGEEITEYYYGEISPIGGKCGVNESEKWKVKKEEYHFYTNYQNQQNMQQRLLLSYLHVMLDALSFMAGISDADVCKSPNLTSICKLSKIIESQKSYSSSTARDHALAKIVIEWNKVLELEIAKLEGKQREEFQRYSWCQIWWAAKEEGETLLGVDDLTGRKRPWP